MTKGYHSYFYCVLAIFIVTALFFLPLFFPHVRILAHPDYGLSDLWNSGYSSRLLLQKSLHQGSLLLWNSKVGMGFPEFAKAEVGALYLPNIITFQLLSFAPAINTQYVLAFLFLSIGMLVYLRSHNLRPLPALIGSVAFAFGAYFIVHLSHISRIQTASMIPIILYTFERLIKRPGLITSIVLSLLLSQQFYAGHFQVVFMTGLTMLAIGVYYFSKKKISVKNLCYTIISLVFFVSLSAIQLLPSLELIHLTSRGAGFDIQGALQFSFPWSQMITFLLPFAQGTPSTGNWQLFSLNGGNIYWENIGYIGIAGLLLAVFGLVRNGKKNNFTLFSGILMTITLLVMTGKYSPLYLLHSFLPFSYFRAPSKYILIFVFFLSVLCAFGAQSLQHFLSADKRTKKSAGIILCAILILLVLDLWHFHKVYTIYDEPEKLLSPPPVTRDIRNDTVGMYRYISFGGSKLWNGVFLKSGWQSMDEFYYLRNILDPNINGLYDLQSFGVYNVLITNRFRLSQNLLTTLELEDKRSTTSGTFEKYLSMQSIKYIISPIGTLKTDPVQIYTPPESYKKRKLSPIGLYVNKSALPRYRLVYDYKVVTTYRDVSRALNDPSFNPKDTVLLENDPQVQFKAPGTQSIKPILLENEKLAFRVYSDTRGIFVLADSFYPGWRVTIDGKMALILPANINQRAVIVPPGKHLIEFMFASESFARGKAISLTGYVIIGFVMVSRFFSQFLRVSSSKR
ncbi:hypothetical protein A3F32_02265 [Candidatus Roizmanbacteria bacterium RIFCSPHIGHO2_12_FULL_42_10]|uniref:Membrane protein 6-pyruvoyl-tetrahydropterin synthase-related domain-containing protein n=1 Tax=Candidatus Roizmanbacteria bacterium RIFCSPHIGHO2_12_FULL_42_10 TaxID=1802053 RepID=A0A1F7I378_9BACT|nr:MAG: hypothetical protein A3F32_02265 [Candidatus Roizmanbacteria bacterium RIFCSPHIGHO2_12_FULL_42_10]